MGPLPDTRYPDPNAPSGAAPPVGFDGMQQPAQQPRLGDYPPADGKPVTNPSGYPTMPVGGQQLPGGYQGAPQPGGPYMPAGAPPPGGPPHHHHAPVGGMPVVGGHGGNNAYVGEDKIGGLGIFAWVLFVIGIFFPICWVVVCFMPLCARNGAKGPRDALAVRRAAIASSVALCLYLVLLVVLVSVGMTQWRNNGQRICVDNRGRQFYC